MNRTASVLMIVLACLLAAMVPAPAQAAGERCRTSASVQRCAEMDGRGSGPSLFADVYVGSLRYPRTKVRWVSVRLQRRTPDGWRTVARNDNQNHDRFRSVSTYAYRPCADSRAGVYRSRAKVEWKRRGQDGTRTATITSRGVRKGRLCG